MTSKTEIARLLKESIFDPRKDGTWAIIVSMNDPKYCEQKAIELIMESFKEKNPTLHDNKIIQAISLLVLSRTLNHGTKENKAY